MKILAERHTRADDAAQIEDRPKDADELALLALGRVAKHERALGRPEQAGAHAEDAPRANDEAACVGMNVDRAKGMAHDGQS